MALHHAHAPERSLGDAFAASAISFGAMGMSEFYGTPPDDNASLTVLERALELGVSLIDSADMYGRGHNELLMGKLIARHRAEYRAGRYAVATKFGLDRAKDDPYKRSINNDPAYIRACCEASLKRLGVERIQLYYAHRINPAADIVETMETLAQLVHEGKIAHVGLCEVSAATLEKAHAVHPVAVVQSEYSLWTRDVESSVLPACRKLGVGFVAYSPLGRGFLTGKYTAPETLEQGDFRLSSPRFHGDNLRLNLALLPVIQAIADQRGCTAAQVALAWLLTREKNLVLIPGTRSVSRLEENCAAAAIVLTDQEIQHLQAAFQPENIHGERYTPEGMKGANA